MPGKRIERADDARLVELARGIVTGAILIADPYERDWQASLALFADTLSEYENLGSVLVPVAPHARGYWLGGTVPAVTLEAVPLAVEDHEALSLHLGAMSAALYGGSARPAPRRRPTPSDGNG